MDADEKKSRCDRRNDSWHVGKEIPIATVVVLVLQTIGVIWLAASTVAKLEFVREAMILERSQQLVIDKRQDDDTRRSEDRIIARLDKQDVKLDRLIEAKK
jgi:hypothetical protein